MGEDTDMMRQFKESMENAFDMTDLGKTRYFLGIEIQQWINEIYLSQRKVCTRCLKKVWDVRLHAYCNTYYSKNYK